MAPYGSHGVGLHRNLLLSDSRSLLRVPPPPPFPAFHPWQPTANPSILPQPSASCPHSTPAILASALAPASLAIKSNPAALAAATSSCPLVLAHWHPKLRAAAPPLLSSIDFLAPSSNQAHAPRYAPALLSSHHNQPSSQLPLPLSRATAANFRTTPPCRTRRLTASTMHQARASRAQPAPSSTIPPERRLRRAAAGTCLHAPPCTCSS